VRQNRNVRPGRTGKFLDMTYDEYLSLFYGGIPLFYKDAALEQPFQGTDKIYPNTIIYIPYDLLEEDEEESRGEKIGEITGMITLTDVPNPAPRVDIYVSGYDSVGEEHWFSYSDSINITGSGTLTNIRWSIPIYENDEFFPSNGNFSLSIRLSNGNRFSIEIPATPYINSVNANVGSLGIVSLKYITLSGTINVTYNGQAVPRVLISAYGTSLSYPSYTSLTSPVANAPWSITMPAFSSSTNISFYVSGFSSNYDNLFSESYVNTVTVYNTDVPNININLGNITSP
ncbi:hypothetical protein, partial [Treponema sp. R6D11]